MAGKDIFNSVKLTRPTKSMFDLSHDVKLSCNMGELVPVMCSEVIPGDHWKVGCESMIRLAPMLAPMMHRVDVSMHYFFVPNRLVWPNWEKFINNNPGGAVPAFPTIEIADGNGVWSLGGLADFLGLPNPAGTFEPATVSAIPFACIQMIYNEYYRDQNLISPVPFELIDGSNQANTALWTLRNRAWEHDYFTSALPFAQKGPAVDIPIGGFNDVEVMRDTAGVAGTSQITPTGGTYPAAFNINVDASPDVSGDVLYAKTSDLVATQSTINDLRVAYRLQEWFEKAARAGSRYTEVIWGHFGVKSADARLQRPEYITGIKTPIRISEVLNTSGTATEPQGNMAGHGIGVTTGKYGSYYATEHGYIIGLMSVMPKTAYQEGIPKHFLKTTDFAQYFWPEFAHLGEQAIQVQELFAYTAAAEDAFGYIPRFSEYRFENNRVAGDFRDSLNFWHMGRIFGAEPALNSAFVTSDPTTRIFAVPGAAQHLWCHVLNKLTVGRLMPKFGTPTF